MMNRKPHQKRNSVGPTYRYRDIGRTLEKTMTHYVPVLAGTQEDFLGLRRGEKDHLAFLLRQSRLSIGPCSLQKEKMHL